MKFVLASAVLLFVTHASWGYFSLQRHPVQLTQDVKVRLIQPNVNQKEKWDTGKTPEIFRSYLDLSNSNTGPKTSNAGAFQFVIWPESAFTFILAEQPDALTAIADTIPDGTVLITGGMRRGDPAAGQSEADIYNAALVLNGEGKIVETRDKTRLVPFGEFLPFQATLENYGFRQLTDLRGGFARGSGRKNVAIEGLPTFLPLICYEVVYPGGLIESTTRPDWLVNLTNDAWFGKTSGPYQHAHQTRVRAVEEGLPIVRVANSGISFVVGPRGRMIDSLPLGAKAVLDAELPLKRADRTFYSRIGNAPIMICICILFFLLIGVRMFNTNRLQ